MIHYAISDGLLGLVALGGAVVLLFGSGKGVPRNLVAAGLLTIALAALTGALRFLTAEHGLLRPPHLWLSEMAGVVGSLWILFGLWRLHRVLPLPVAVPYLLPPLIFVATLWLGQTQMVILIATLCLLVGQIASLISLFKQGHIAPVIAMLVASLCLVAVSATEALFPDRPDHAWHYYHGMMALWALALIMAVRASLSNSNERPRRVND